MGNMIRHVSFLSPTTSGTQDITISGLGTPIGALSIASVNTSGNTAASGTSINFGFCDGTTENGVAVQALNGLGVTRTRRIGYDDAFIKILDPANTGVVIAEASFDSWITDGIRLNWTTVHATNQYQVNITLIPSGDLSVSVGKVATNSTQNGDVSASLAFEPDLVLFCSVGTTTAQLNTFQTNARLSLGAASNESNIVQGCFGYNNADSAATTLISSSMNNNYCAKPHLNSMELTSFNTNGFTITTRDTAGGHDLFYLAINFNHKLKSKISFIDSSTITGNKSYNIDLGAQFVLLLESFLEAYNTVNSAELAGSIGVGLFDSDLSQKAYSFSSTDNAADSSEITRANTKTSYIFNHDHTLSIQSTISSINSSGYVLNYSVTNANAKKWISIAISENVVMGDVDLFIRGTPDEPLLAIRTISDTAPSSSSQQDFLIDGMGTTKGAIAIVSNARIGDGLASYGMLSVGFTDGTNDVGCCYYLQDASTEQHTRSSIYDNCFIKSLYLSESINVSGSLNSFISDGICIDWNLNTSPLLTTQLILFYGDIEVKVGQFTADSTVGSGVSISGLGFEPDFVFLTTVGGTPANSVGVNQRFGFGAANKAESGIVQGSIAHQVTNRTSPGNTAVTSQINNNVAGYNNIEISSFDSDGFTATTVASSVSSNIYNYFAFKHNGNIKTKIGFIDSPTTSGNYSISGVGFMPQFVLELQSYLESYNTSDTTDLAGPLGIGCSDIDGRQTSHANMSKDNVATSKERGIVATSTSTIYDHDSVSGILSTYVSMDRDGYTHNYSQTNPTAKKWIYFAFGVETVSGSLDLSISGATAETQISGSMDLFIHGRESINNNIDLFINGKDIQSNNLDLFVNGKQIISNSVDLFINGNELANDNIDLFIHGYETISGSLDLSISGSAAETLVNNSIDLFINGHQNISNSLDLFIYGFAIISNALDLFIRGHEQLNNNLDLFINGHETLSNNINFIIIGEEANNNNVDLFIHGNDIENNNINLFIHGHQTITNNVDLIIIGKDTNNNNINLFILGSQNVSGSIDLFINGNEQQNQSLDLFIKGLDVLNENITLFISSLNVNTNSVDLFIHGRDSSNNNIDLFINGHETISNNLDLIILGNDIQNNNLDLFINGFNSFNNNLDLFINGQEILNNDLTLFINGMNSVSGDITLFISSSNISTNSVDLFIDGFDRQSQSIDLLINGFIQISNNINLFINGHDTQNNNIDLFVNGYNTLNNNIDLFIHGSQEINNNIDLIINAHQLINNNLDLSIVGHNLQNNNIDLYISGIQNTVNNDIDLFISGSGIFPVSGSIDLFINSLGMEDNSLDLFIHGIIPRPEVSCPILDTDAAIQIGSDIIEIYQSRIDALINQLGKNIILEFNPIIVPCRNCIFDPIRKRSTGEYKIGGPRPFQNGRQCPWCKGRGFEETQETRCIQGLIKFNPKDIANYNISVNNNKSIIRVKTFLYHADDIKKTKTAIIDSDQQSIVIARSRLIKGPVPVGLRDDRYIISFWELI